MRGSRWFLGWGATLLGFVCGCSSNDEKNPYLGGGTTSFFAPGTIGGKGGGGGGGSGLGDGGLVGNGTLSGTVSVYQDQFFSAVQPFAGGGDITVKGNRSVTDTFVNGQFSVSGVDQVPTLWVGIRATTGGTDLLPTIAPASSAAASVALAFGKKSAVTDILGLALNPAQVLESDKAQILLGFVTASATPVALQGVKISQSPGKTVLYDAGGTYTDQPDSSTQGRGVAFIANVTAGSDFPGSPAVVGYTVKTSTGGTLGTTPFVIQIPVTAGAITIALVAVQ